MQLHYGHMARLLHWCIDQSATYALEKLDLTAAQGRIMVFLTMAQSPPCPRDIENQFHLSHPTVSGLLSRLEQKGFLELRTDPEDRRCKRIYLLDKGYQCHDRMEQAIQEIESQMVRGFTVQEQEQFSQLLQRAIHNMGGSFPCQLEKEETNT